ncbi:MAG: YchJ family protein [Kiritimatiellae bacterium]|nr:YchJ family protein [Kiritimatiellia bacterium]MDD4623486.1 YchJ family protein [Kiritimatiellia bacterium]
MSDLCPCGSNLGFEACCEPYLLGKARPPTAVALMRSRYTAYAMGAVDYLFKTSGPKVRKEFDGENTKKWSDSAEWTGIEILEEQGGKEHDESAKLEFIARYSVNGTAFNHHESASFAKKNGEWIFMDGKIYGPDPIMREHPKVGRNDPCPCGSGRKFKKCCYSKAQ